MFGNSIFFFLSCQNSSLLHYPPSPPFFTTLQIPRKVGIQLKIALHKRTLCRQRRIIKLRLSHDQHASAPYKLKVGCRSSRVNLANQFARRIKHVDAIAHSSIYVAVAVAVHAVGDVGVDKGKGFAVLKRAVFEDVEAVAIIYKIFFFLCF